MLRCHFGDIWGEFDRYLYFFGANGLNTSFPSTFYHATGELEGAYVGNRCWTIAEPPNMKTCGDTHYMDPLRYYTKHIQKKEGHTYANKKTNTHTHRCIFIQNCLSSKIPCKKFEHCTGYRNCSSLHESSWTCPHFIRVLA